MANQENKDFSEDVNESYEQNGDGENGGAGDAAENGQGESQEDR